MKCDKDKRIDGFFHKLGANYVKGVDKSVESIFDGVMSGFEMASTPVKALLQGMSGKEVLKMRWFTLDAFAKDLTEITNAYQIESNKIHDGARNVQEFLSSLKSEDSVSLIRALNGDIDKVELSPTLSPYYDRFRSVIDANAARLVELGALDETNKIEHYLKRYYTQYLEEKEGLGSFLSEKFKRKKMSLDERVAMGMVEDASFVISKTIAEQNIQIQKALLLERIAESFGSSEKGPGLVKISSEKVGGVNKYGALGGKWVPQEVSTAFEHSRIIGNELSTLEKYLYPMVDHLKVNLTVKNPVTHLYNVGSNTILATINGDMISLAKVLHMRATSPQKFKDLVKRANDLGLNSYLDDIEDHGVELSPNKRSVNVMKSILNNLYLSQNSKTGQGARKLYDWEDKIFKLSGFKRLLDEGMEEKAAFKASSEVYVDYSTPLPGGIKFLDKSGLQPFLHYQYKATPATMKTMLKNPFTTLLLGTGAAQLGIFAWQDEHEKNLKPEWAENKFNLFAFKEWYNLGNGYYLNMGRMIPGTKLDFDLGGFVKGSLDMFNGSTPLGYDISGVYDPKLEQYAERFVTMAENYMPPITFGRYGQRTIATLAGHPKKNYYDEDMGLGEIGVRALGVRRFNESKELGSNLSKAKSRYRFEIKEADKLKGVARSKAKRVAKDKYNKRVRVLKAAGRKAKVKVKSSESTRYKKFKVK